MIVHVVIREDQNEHGFIDTSVVGLFSSPNEADAFVKSSVAEARKEGLRVSGDRSASADWEVYWKVEDHSLS